MPALVKTLEGDADSIVRGSAATALGSLGDPAATAPLRVAIERQPDAPREALSAISALLLVDPDATTWLVHFATMPGRRLAPATRGRIALAVANGPGFPAGDAWLRTVVWKDHYGAARGPAVRGLAQHGRLDAETVRFIIDPSFHRRDGACRDPDLHIRSRVVASLFAEHMDERPLAPGLIELAVAQLADPSAAIPVAAPMAALYGAPPTKAATLVSQIIHTMVGRDHPVLQSAIGDLQQRLAHLADARRSLSMLSSAPQGGLQALVARVPTILQQEPTMAEKPVAFIITAVLAERRAALESLRTTYNVSPTPFELNGRYYDRLSWPGRTKSWDLYLGQPTDKGPHAAQALVQDFVRNKAPKIVLMVGMCGGLPEHGAKEGDVVVARQVFNYEPGRQRDGSPGWTPSAYRSSPRLLNLANHLAANARFGEVKVHANKDYGSGESLLDDLASEVRQRIVAFSDDLIAFEMEGVGLLHAALELQCTHPADFGLVKGVADYGDGHQRDNKDVRQRTATQNAIAVALSLLSEY